jgi:hypothetical protein
MSDHVDRAAATCFGPDGQPLNACIKKQQTYI